MLGYVRTYKPEMKFKEYDVYRGVYCTLCKALLRRYSPLGQLFLSYDVTFLALLLLSVSDNDPSMCRARCCVNPLKKCTSCGRGAVLDFCADVSVMMFYHKILDDLHDHGFFKKLLALTLYPAAWCMHRKAVRLQPQAAEVMRILTARQAQIEQDVDCSLDRAAQPSADGLRQIAAIYCANETFGRLVYLLGRYVYLIDAVDDVQKDLRSGNFNPLKGLYRQDAKQFYNRAMEMLNFNISEMLQCFDAIPFNRFSDIIYNVLFNGLYNSALYVTQPHSHSKEART